jgi:hypothetical protein
MPIWKGGLTAARGESQGIIESVRAGKVLPILSQNAMFDVALFGFEAFRRYYADSIQYVDIKPPDSSRQAADDRDAELPDISRLTSYDRYVNNKSAEDCRRFYVDCLKNHIYNEAEAAGVPAKKLAEAGQQVDEVSVALFPSLLGYPRFDQDQTLPLQTLANLPFKMYLTLDTTTLLETALRKADKKPTTLMCRWQGPLEAPEQALWRMPAKSIPDKDAPLVYHLCGLDTYPESLALSEDDHLELLVNLAESRGKGDADRVPAVVRGAPFEGVLLLGFRVNTWAFRAVYYGLIRGAAEARNPRGVCVLQLPEGEREKQEKYLQTYLKDEARFELFLGDLSEYASELGR